MKIEHDETGHGIVGRFIEANTETITLEALENNFIIPVFSKDNERVISHPEFIQETINAVESFYGNQAIQKVDVKVSHLIKGRIPEAMHKAAKDLLEHETTKYFERMAFMITLNETAKVGLDNMQLSIGGIRAYNLENLSGKKKMELFKTFVGYNNFVCTNLALNTDGVNLELKASSISELSDRIIMMLQGYDPKRHIESLQELQNVYISEHDFAQLIGKTRLYNHLPTKDEIPKLLINDGMINTIAQGYYSDPNFSRDNHGNINLWNVYNLFTGAVKNSYIDTFVDRSLNAGQLVNGLYDCLTNKDDSYAWYIN